MTATSDYCACGWQKPEIECDVPANVVAAGPVIVTVTCPWCGGKYQPEGLERPIGFLAWMPEEGS